MFDIAFKEIDEMNFFWQSQARRIVREVLIGEYPERFFATDFVDDVSAKELTKWLYFAFEEQKGLIWIDDLRRKIKEPWYEKDWFTTNDETKSNSGKNFDFFGNITSGFSSMSERIKDNIESGSGLNKNIGIGLNKEQTILIPAIKKMIARINWIFLLIYSYI